ncbi:ATPase domain-containing protein [Natrononativus amylolyticus]|uniref:ATPase domain-containing protein n=1 Tax=Natrononativus amylolyticus TaxID=2963434 RepID=UPI003CE53B86
MVGLPPRLSTGVAGLDDVLHGGYLAGDAYLLRGELGTGKTLLGLHFLRDGADAGETVLFINLEESEAKTGDTLRGRIRPGRDRLSRSESSL